MNPRSLSLHEVWAATFVSETLRFLPGTLAPATSKRHDKRQVHFLTRPEIEAVLAVPDQTKRLGRRHHTLLLVAAQAGSCLSELTALTEMPSTSGPARTYDASVKGERSGPPR